MDPRALRFILIVLAASLALISCGSDDENGDRGASPAPEATEPAETSASAQREALEDTGSKPVIPKPSGSPPSRLQKEDVVKGKGPAAKPGDLLTVHYAGVTFSTGEEFDASWNTGRPFTFGLGGGQVIPGWDRGLVGMKKGGRRMLTIPPELAYGPQGSPPAIGPNETLVFVVDVLAIRRG